MGTTVAVVLLAGAAFTGHRILTRPTAAQPSITAAPPPVATTNPAAGPATVLPGPTASASAQVSAPPSPTGAAGTTPVPTTAAPTGAAPAPPPPPLPAAGSFELASDVAEISIKTARLASGIAQVTSPAGGRAVPKLRLAGATAKLTVAANGDKETKVAVVLDERVAWTVRIGGGTRTTRIDLSDGAVTRIDLVGGTHDIDLRLPRLRSTLPVRMSGGVNTWRITTPDRTPVRLVARDGAGRVKLYGDDRGGLGKGVRVSATAGSGGRLDLDAVGGIGSLTVAER